MIEMIVSGGQTGVDRAALDVALELNINYGGWCPQGRIDENGVIPLKYSNLKEVEGIFESDTINYNTRTKLNIRDSDGTLIIVSTIPLPSNIKDGTILTFSEVKAQNKPSLVISLSEKKTTTIQGFKDWIIKNEIKILNIAGPRESTCPGICSAASEVINEIICDVYS